MVPLGIRHRNIGRGEDTGAQESNLPRSTMAAARFPNYGRGGSPLPSDRTSSSSNISPGYSIRGRANAHPSSVYHDGYARDNLVSYDREYGGGGTNYGNFSYRDNYVDKSSHNMSNDYAPPLPGRDFRVQHRDYDRLHPHSGDESSHTRHNKYRGHQEFSAVWHEQDKYRPKLGESHYHGAPNYEHSTNPHRDDSLASRTFKNDVHTEFNYRPDSHRDLDGISNRDSAESNHSSVPSDRYVIPNRNLPVHKSNRDHERRINYYSSKERSTTHVPFPRNSQGYRYDHNLSPSYESSVSHNVPLHVPSSVSELNRPGFQSSPMRQIFVNSDRSNLQSANTNVADVVDFPNEQVQAEPNRCPSSPINNEEPVSEPVPITLLFSNSSAGSSRSPTPQSPIIPKTSTLKSLTSTRITAGSRSTTHFSMEMLNEVLNSKDPEPKSALVHEAEFSATEDLSNLSPSSNRSPSVGEYSSHPLKKEKHMESPIKHSVVSSVPEITTMPSPLSENKSSTDFHFSKKKIRQSKGEKFKPKIEDSTVLNDIDFRNDSGAIDVGVDDDSAVDYSLDQDSLSGDFTSKSPKKKIKSPITTVSLKHSVKISHPTKKKKKEILSRDQFIRPEFGSVENRPEIDDNGVLDILSEDVEFDRMNLVGMDLESSTPQPSAPVRFDADLDVEDMSLSSSEIESNSNKEQLSGTKGKKHLEISNSASASFSKELLSYSPFNLKPPAFVPDSLFAYFSGKNGDNCFYRDSDISRHFNYSLDYYKTQRELLRNRHASIIDRYIELTMPIGFSDEESVASKYSPVKKDEISSDTLAKVSKYLSILKINQAAFIDFYRKRFRSVSHYHKINLRKAENLDQNTSLISGNSILNVENFIEEEVEAPSPLLSTADVVRSEEEYHQILRQLVISDRRNLTDRWMLTVSAVPKMELNMETIKSIGLLEENLLDEDPRQTLLAHSQLQMAKEKTILASSIRAKSKNSITSKMISSYSPPISNVYTACTGVRPFTAAEISTFVGKYLSGQNPGKRFDMLQRALPGRSQSELVQYYYENKKRHMFKKWMRTEKHLNTDKLLSGVNIHLLDSLPSSDEKIRQNMYRESLNRVWAYKAKIANRVAASGITAGSRLTGGPGIGGPPGNNLNSSVPKGTNKPASSILFSSSMPSLVTQITKASSTLDTLFADSTDSPQQQYPPAAKRPGRPPGKKSIISSSSVNNSYKGYHVSEDESSDAIKIILESNNSNSSALPSGEHIRSESVVNSVNSIANTVNPVSRPRKRAAGGFGSATIPDSNLRRQKNNTLTSITDETSLDSNLFHRKEDLLHSNRNIALGLGIDGNQPQSNFFISLEPLKLKTPPVLFEERMHDFSFKVDNIYSTPIYYAAFAQSDGPVSDSKGKITFHSYTAFWTPLERQQLVSLFLQYGKQWDKIASGLRQYRQLRGEIFKQISNKDISKIYLKDSPLFKENTMLTSINKSEYFFILTGPLKAPPGKWDHPRDDLTVLTMRSYYEDIFVQGYTALEKSITEELGSKNLVWRNSSSEIFLFYTIYKRSFQLNLLTLQSVSPPTLFLKGNTINSFSASSNVSDINEKQPPTNRNGKRRSAGELNENHTKRRTSNSVTLGASHTSETDSLQISQPGPSLRKRSKSTFNINIDNINHEVPQAGSKTDISFIPVVKKGRQKKAAQQTNGISSKNGLNSNTVVTAASSSNMMPSLTTLFSGSNQSKITPTVSTCLIPPSSSSNGMVAPPGNGMMKGIVHGAPPLWLHHQQIHPQQQKNLLPALKPVQNSASYTTTVSKTSPVEANSYKRSSLQNVVTILPRLPINSPMSSSNNSNFSASLSNNSGNNINKVCIPPLYAPSPNSRGGVTSSTAPSPFLNESSITSNTISNEISSIQNSLPMLGSSTTRPVLPLLAPRKINMTTAISNIPTLDGSTIKCTDWRSSAQSVLSKSAPIIPSGSTSSSHSSSYQSIKPSGKRAMSLSVPNISNHPSGSEIQPEEKLNEAVGTTSSSEPVTGINIEQQSSLPVAPMDTIIEQEDVPSVSSVNAASCENPLVPEVSIDSTILPPAQIQSPNSSIE